MGKNVIKKRSRRRSNSDDSDKRKSCEPIQLPLDTILRNDLHDFVVFTGLEVLEALLESERTQLCGPRYSRASERSAYRSGHTKGELVMGGRRVSVRRPRARTKDNEEAHLPSWEYFQAEDPLDRRAVEQMVIGVSTRKYERSLEGPPPEVKTRGTSKSAVSRRFVAVTQKRFEEWMNRNLSQLRLASMMIDGVHFADHLVLVALGIDEEGYKHVLGLWEGATENATACKALLNNLIDRGLPAEQSLLFVIDGGKAIHTAIRQVFGDRALIQRCQVHKKRNVMEHLPDEMRGSIGATMSQAYQTSSPKTAKKLLENLARQLKKDHPGAAASLEEGLEETLTVKGLGLSKNLERILSTTNAIENLIGTGRYLSRRVKCWRGGQMILRWLATAMNEAAKKFRRVTGYKGLSKLVIALKANDMKIDGVDSEKKVA